jgi:hypothetical protein
MENQSSLAAEYRIRVKDHLDPCWSEWFEDWELAHLENGEFLLVRTQVDQSALHGVLNKILDLNLTLVSVTRIPSNPDNS